MISAIWHRAFIAGLLCFLWAAEVRAQQDGQFGFVGRQNFFQGFQQGGQFGFQGQQNGQFGFMGFQALGQFGFQGLQQNGQFGFQGLDDGPLGFHGLRFAGPVVQEPLGRFAFREREDNGPGRRGRGDDNLAFLLRGQMLQQQQMSVMQRLQMGYGMQLSGGTQFGPGMMRRPFGFGGQFGAQQNGQFGPQQNGQFGP
jgi:hypothetical protein